MYNYLLNKIFKDLDSPDFIGGARQMGNGQCQIRYSLALFIFFYYYESIA